MLHDDCQVVCVSCGRRVTFDYDGRCMMCDMSMTLEIESQLSRLMPNWCDDDPTKESVETDHA